MKDILRIQFTGTQSTGKTTLVTEIEKRLGVKALINQTRSVPKELRGTAAGQMMIYDHYCNVWDSQEESYACDRTMYDMCAYSKVAGVWDDSFIAGLLMNYRWARFYPSLIVYLPIEFPMTQDGERPDDANRREVDKCIRGLLTKYCPRFITATGSVEERLQYIFSELSSLSQPLQRECSSYLPYIE